MRRGRAGRQEPYDVVFYQPYISSLYAPQGNLPSGGAEAQIKLIAEALAARGFRVAVVANPILNLPRRVGGVDVIQRRARSSQKLSRVTAAVAGWFALARLPTRTIVKRVAGFDTFMVALAARLRGRRFVYSSANVIDFDFSRLDSRPKATLFELGVRLASEIVVQSEEQVALCRHRFGRDPVVIKSIAELEPARAEPPRAFVWIGRLVPYKRPLDFVDLARALPEVQFEMIPVLTADHDRALHERIRSAARALPNLQLSAARSRAAVGELLRSAVAAVNTAEYEGMPNVLLEGWSRGVPALALNHDPDGVIEREGLGGFAAGSARRFIELATEMWQARDDRVDLAQRCREYVAREHSPTAVGERWAAVLNSEGRG